MAGKKGQKDFDALGSIFDFLFTEAKKPPDRRKPARITGLSTNSMLTDALTAALEKPGAFISETVVDEFNGALDLELSVSPYRGVGKVKVTSNNLVDLIKDPQKFMEKNLKTTQAIRKGMRAQFAGQIMTDFIYSGWAHKYGDLEVKNAVSSIADTRRKSEAIYDVTSAIGQAASGKFIDTEKFSIANRNVELIGREVFGEDGWTRVSNNKQVEEKKLKFSRFLAGYGADPNKDGFKMSDEIEAFLIREFGPTQGKTYFDRYKDSYRLEKGEQKPHSDIFDPKVLLHLEGRNIGRRIDTLNNDIKTRGIKAGDQEALNTYEKTKMLLNKEKGRKDLLDRINMGRASLKSGSLTSAEEKILRKDIKDARAALRVINGGTVIGKIGEWEGYFNSMKNIYTGGNLATAILSGDFYDKNKNKLYNPVVETEWKVNGITYAFNKAKREIDPVTDLPKNNLLDVWNQTGMRVYYMTPRSLFRTLFYNGEGFQYLLSHKLSQIEALTGGLAPGDKFNSAIFLGNKKGTSFNLQTTLVHLKGKLSPADYEKVAKLLKSSAGLKRLLNLTSIPYQVQYKLNKALGVVTKKFRVKLARQLLKNQSLKRWLTNSAAGKLFGQWIAKGGIDIFARSMVTAVATALGFVGGPIGSFLVGLGTILVTDVMIKTAGWFLNVLKYAILGLIGVFILIGGMSMFRTKNFFQRNAVAHTVIPGDVKMCDLYEFTELDPNEPSPWGPVIIPPPSDEECILDTPSPTCTQGWVGDNLFSHGGIKSLMPIDLAAQSALKYVYAPQFCNTGDCRITQVSQINCKIDQGKYAGGAVIFEASTGSVTYTFRMYHVRPLTSVNEKVSGGQAIASVQDYPEIPTDSFCWTAAHIHFEVKQNGAPINPLELLRGFNCSVYEKSCP